MQRVYHTGRTARATSMALVSLSGGANCHWGHELPEAPPVPVLPKTGAGGTPGNSTR